MEHLLREGLKTLGLSAEAAPALAEYARRLEEKNQVMNLTAITDPAQVAALHFLDSAALLTLTDLREKSLVDVGTGAGFPGLVLRILEPSLRLTLLDAQRKRLDFLGEVCNALGLEDVERIHSRAEDFAAQRRETFDLAASRAVAALPVLTELCLPLVKPGGAMLAMKSVDCGQELNSAARAIRLLGGGVERTMDYALPGTDVVHRLIVIRKLQKTPEGYPRTFAKIKKEPL